MEDSEKQRIQEQARKDARSGVKSTWPEVAAAARLGSTNGPQNDAYQAAFKAEQKKPTK